jgi:DNA ligase (NAD+)
MASGDRKEMEATARTLGASVGSSVTSKTSLLVCGAKVGAKKSEAAKALGVRVISEGEYLALLQGE